MTLVLITGGAGFIGANLCRRLLDDGHRVRVVDNLSTGFESNLAGLDLDLVVGDIRDGELVERLCRDAETVVHLAARGSVPRSIDGPLETHDVNVNGTLNVLSAVRQHDCHLVFSSSSSVYGANLQLPKREAMRTEPLSPYAASKLAGEAYALSFANVYKLDVLVFRFFNVYGPLQSAGHVYAAVIPAFVHALLTQQVLRVFGDGTQSRDFTSVRSVVEVLSRAIGARTSTTQPINLAFNTSTTLLHLIDVLEKLTERSARVEFAPARPGDVSASQADPSRLLSLFPGLVPVDLISGLSDTVEWFRK